MGYNQGLPRILKLYYVPRLECRGVSEIGVHLYTYGDAIQEVLQNNKNIKKERKENLPNLR